MAAARVDIEGQHNAAGRCNCCNCSPPQLRMQDQMPAQLQGPVSEAAWQDFITKANGVLADTSEKMRCPMMGRSIASSLGSLLLILGPIIYAVSMTSRTESYSYDRYDRYDRGSYDPTASTMSRMIPLMVGMLSGVILLLGGMCFFGKKMVAIANEGLEALKRVCAQATDANPGVSFIVKDEYNTVIGSKGRAHTVRTNYVEVSVARAPVNAVGMVASPAVVVMAQPDGGGGAKFCPNCGNPCSGARFCSQCGSALP